MSEQEQHEEKGSSIPKKKIQGGQGLRHSRNNKIYYAQFPLSRVFKLSVDLDQDLGEYLRQNSISLNQLCHLSISQFISVPQKIELLPVANSKKRLWTEEAGESAEGTAQSKKRNVPPD